LLALNASLLFEEKYKLNPALICFKGQCVIRAGVSRRLHLPSPCRTHFLHEH